MAFSPDGKFLAAGDSTATSAIWDVGSHARVAELASGHTMGVNDIAFSPDGNMVVSGGDDSKVILWRMMPREPLALGTLSTEDGVSAFSPDGRTLAIRAGNNVTLWDVIVRTRLATLPGAGSVVFSRMAVR